jgi:hypothetical protein
MGCHPGGWLEALAGTQIFGKRVVHDVLLDVATLDAERHGVVGMSGASGASPLFLPIGISRLSLMEAKSPTQ